jgi:uncharacterized protein YkwD
MSRPSIAHIALVVALAVGAPTAAWDLTRPLDEVCPPPIGITPEWPVTAAAPDADDPTFEDRLIELVNQERWANGQLPPLKRVDLLDNSTETHCSNMATRDFVMHCDPDTFTLPWDRMNAAGYIHTPGSAMENIAWGFAQPEGVMDAWMNSPGHRSAILSTSVYEMGNGYVYQAGDQPNIRQSSVGGSSCTPDIFNQGPFSHYWTQNFGRRSSVYPLIINREAYLTETRAVDLYVYGFWTEIRLRNEDGPWTDWQSFDNDIQWQLSAGNGTKTVTAEFRSTSTVYSYSDTIILEDATELIFDDDFESGSWGAWSAAVP